MTGQIQRLGDIVADKGEALVIQKLFDIFFAAGNEIIHADNLMLIFYKSPG
jgi:hypothetical protein